VFTYLCTVAGIDFKTDNMHKAGLLFFSRLYIPFGFDTFYGYPSNVGQHVNVILVNLA